MEEVKIGDRVRYIGDDSNYYHKGAEGILIKERFVKFDKGYWKPCDDDSWWVSHCFLKKVQPTTEDKLKILVNKVEELYNFVKELKC